MSIKTRQERSLLLDVIEIKEDKMFRVNSLTNFAQSYLVYVNYNSDRVVVKCNCKSGNMGKEGCSHALAVLRYVAEKNGSKLSFWDSENEARSQKHRVVQVGRNLWATVRK